MALLKASKGYIIKEQLKKHLNVLLLVSLVDLCRFILEWFLVVSERKSTVLFVVVDKYFSK